jgi:hemoglobin
LGEDVDVDGEHPTADGPDGEDLHRVSVYAAVGGQRFFDRLVDRFYAAVEADEVLLRLYPDPQDLAPARRRLATFLAQYWGGPTTYSDERGHPRLRMRHLPFPIGDAERDHWVRAMLGALAATLPETPLDDELRAVVAERMTDYTVRAAQHLVNHPG